MLSLTLICGSVCVVVVVVVVVVCYVRLLVLQKTRVPEVAHSFAY
jgi:hypothetical protein